MPKQSLQQRVNRLLRDHAEALLADAPLPDLKARWQKIVADGVGAEAEHALGPMPVPTLDDVPLSDSIPYACADADATLRVLPYLESEIRRLGLCKALDIDLAVIPMIAEMTQTGMLVDREQLSTLSDVFNDSIKDITERCYKLAGHEFNLESGDQKAQVLYGELRLRYGKMTKSGKRKAVDEKALSALAGQHPIVALLKEYAEVSKLKHSYVDTLPALLSEDGRWRYELGMATVPSGRLNGWGGVNPLAIPVRTALGREIRRAFVAPPGRMLGAVDLNQVELRALAILSQDEHLLDAYYNGLDLHALTAAEAIFHIPLSAVTYEQRQRGKTTNFAIANQIGARSLADQFHVSGITDIDEVECQHYLDNWYKRYSGVQPWYESVYAEGKRQGFIRDSLSGRILYTPGLQSDIDKVRTHAERVATNWMLQVFAQVIGKAGMADIWENRAEYPDVSYLLYIHDELLTEYDADWEPGEVLTGLMTGTEIAQAQPIPIEAAWHSANNWAELK